MPILDFLESVNQRLFLILNASVDTASWEMEFAKLSANYAIYLVPVALVCFWLRGSDQERGGLVMAVVVAELGLLINQLIPLWWFHPRPFMVPVGRTFVEHAADSSFPSDHLTFIIGVAFALAYWNRRHRAALVIGAIGMLVAWARIFIGVHFPFDMIGSAVTAAIALIILIPANKAIQSVLVGRVAIPVYRTLFAPAIKRGWCR